MSSAVLNHSCIWVPVSEIKLQKTGARIEKNKWNPFKLQIHGITEYCQDNVSNENAQKTEKVDYISAQSHYIPVWIWGAASLRAFSIITFIWESRVLADMDGHIVKSMKKETVNLIVNLIRFLFCCHVTNNTDLSNQWVAKLEWVDLCRLLLCFTSIDHCVVNYIYNVVQGVVLGE